MANGKQLSQKGAEEVLDIIDSYIDVKEAVELFKKKPLGYEMKPELEIYTDGFKDGYNKANEWHYVKDGDLPKDDNYVLVSNGKDWTKAFYKDKKWNIICLVGFTKIIAWKEIVLSELPKESE